MSDVVTGIAQAVATLKPIERWFSVVTVVAAIALWTLEPGDFNTSAWKLRAVVVGGWSCVAFGVLPVAYVFTGIAWLLRRPPPTKPHVIGQTELPLPVVEPAREPVGKPE